MIYLQNFVYSGQEHLYSFLASERDDLKILNHFRKGELKKTFRDMSDVMTRLEGKLLMAGAAACAGMNLYSLSSKPKSTALWLSFNTMVFILGLDVFKYTRERPRLCFHPKVVDVVASVGTSSSNLLFRISESIQNIIHR